MACEEVCGTTTCSSKKHHSTSPSPSSLSISSSSHKFSLSRNKSREVMKKVHAFTLILAIISSQCFLVTCEPSPLQGSSALLPSDVFPTSEKDDVGSATPLLLNLVNPCAIAAAVFGAPAVPYVIPCTILRRIRLFRETLSDSSPPPVTSIANLLSDRQKLLVGNLVMGAVSSSSNTPGSIFKTR